MEKIGTICYNIRKSKNRTTLAVSCKGFRMEINMLNENKIKMMTKMAAYEKNVGKREIAICRYFKSDYTSIGVLKTIISMTIAYLLCVVVYIVCNIDYYLQNLAKLDYAGMMLAIGKNYVVVIAVFSVISYLVYSVRYDQAKKNITAYSKRLKKLEKYYKKESKASEKQMSERI